ncbi:hypothetical protein [Lentimicrobium sp. S6]|uniref:hypothetical protein n=1 Tax=Lentimicrobium sp. S6 TaxID=2735872 RepID=UPI001551E9DD|nr:hypothetical protein [Lentimicrobium sp. S6]NPD48171.1 hypothetical protein [Lentimicrobium sp. S6]
MSKNSNDIKGIFEKFISDFVKKDKQERMFQFLKKEKNWWKIINEFHSSTPFDKSVLQDIKPNEQYSEPIFKQLRKLGAETECYSLLDYLDNNEYQFVLSEKLTDTVGFLVETIIFCPKSGIGYFEGGHAKDRFILKKAKK